MRDRGNLFWGGGDGLGMSLRRSRIRGGSGSGGLVRGRGGSRVLCDRVLRVNVM